MEYYVENRQTPIIGSYDVIVAGGGPAGVPQRLAAHGRGALSPGRADPVALYPGCVKRSSPWR